jgi:hypothetical protein
MNHNFRQYTYMYLLVVSMLVLNSCAGGGIPITAAEMKPITEQALVTGVASIMNGAQPLAKVLENSFGTRLLVWPGARSGTDILWNMACLIRCNPGWQAEVTHYLVGPGQTMRAEPMSAFVQSLKNSGWREIVPTAVAVGKAVGSGVGGAVSTLTGVIIDGFTVIPVTPSTIEMIQEPKT